MNCTEACREGCGRGTCNTILTAHVSVYRDGNHQSVKQEEIMLHLIFQLGFVFQWILPGFLSFTVYFYVIAEHNGFRPRR